MRSLIIATLFCTPVLFAQGHGLTVESAALEIRNADVTWDGTLIGLVPSTQGQAVNFLSEHPSEARSHLIAALKDPKRFVVAHVLLTFSEKAKFEFSASRWNRLNVVLRANGTAEIDPEQRHDLYNFWQAKYGGA